MAWWKRSKPEQRGVLLFRGVMVPRAEDLCLERRGMSVAASRRTETGWEAELRHPAWGAARLSFEHGRRDDLPEALVRFDRRLNQDEREAVASCRTSLALEVTSRTGNVLRDRKDLLRFMLAVLGDEGVAGVDLAAQAIWTRRALEEELVHDAELDIDAIYTIHAITAGEAEADGEREAYWLHSHGLGELGYFDFDVLDPAAELDGHAHELLRALAFAVVEGTLVQGGAPVILVEGVGVRAVPVDAFLAGASPGAHARYRKGLEDSHRHGHAILCDPVPEGWLGRMLRGGRPVASTFLKGPFPEEVLIPFSEAATDLMARRARETVGVLRAVAEELAEFEAQPLVKLGYPSEKDSREHLWFEVHAIGPSTVDATLVNAPFDVPTLKKGDRGEHSLELLSDWVVFTPFGRIDPRQSRTLRFVREHRDGLGELLAQAKARGEA